MERHEKTTEPASKLSRTSPCLPEVVPLVGLFKCNPIVANNKAGVYSSAEMQILELVGEELFKWRSDLNVCLGR